MPERGGVRVMILFSPDGLWESSSTCLTVVSFSTALEREQMIKLTESLEIDIKVMVTRLSKC